MKKIILSVISIPITLLFSVNKIFEYYSTGHSSDSLMQSILNANSIDELFLQGFCVGCVIPLMFALIWGIYFYRDLQIGGVYIFVRQKSRLKWYWKRCLSIFIYCVVYTLLFVFIKDILCFGFSSKIFDKNNIISVLKICLSSLQIGLICAVIINFFAIFFGSNIGYLLGIIIDLSLLGAGFLFRFSTSVYASVNPFTAYIRSFESDFNIIELIIQTMSIVLTFTLGYYAVKKMDIGLVNKEI